MHPSSFTQNTGGCRLGCTRAVIIKSSIKPSLLFVREEVEYVEAPHFGLPAMYGSLPLTGHLILGDKEKKMVSERGAVSDGVPAVGDTRRTHVQNSWTKYSERSVSSAGSVGSRGYSLSPGEPHVLRSSRSLHDVSNLGTDVL
ncbi:hypothetical protein E2C01_039827 [Portunus trituberculatus]|uniref:Uncharacterized protein n=1 Tax=Portunus trituberculatus TaxID=210409 RepID=A0A5B7FMA6_PORTR|nr:hypothetical protein [Portunus trituberculatus]